MLQTAAPVGETRPTCWTIARDGRRLDLLNPTVDMIHIDDVAVSLARQSRYNAWLDIPVDDIFSIAQHSVYVARTMTAHALNEGLPKETVKRLGLIGLGHDVSEYAIKDIITPMKVILPDYQALEQIWEPVAYEWIGAPDPTPDELAIMHWADRRVLIQEMKQFNRNVSWHPGHEQIPPLFSSYPAHGHTVWKPSVSYAAFIAELETLQNS